jgi:putative DNA primase/helicase
MSQQDNVTPLWKALLQWANGKDGEPQLVACATNVAALLTHDSGYAGCFARNELRGQTELVKKLPQLTGLLQPRLGVVDDYVLSYTRSALVMVNKLRVGADVGLEGIEYAARQRCFNPLHDYLLALKWDGVQRLGTWLFRYLGAEPGQYTESVGRWWLVSAMARAFRPGCKADHVLVLEGPQGVGKSSAIKILGGDWCLSRLPPLRDYSAAALAMAGAWMVEMGEMEAFRGAAATQIKDFLSQSEDRYRPPYGRFIIEQPRNCVFAGSTNDASYLRDPTGARRFWPVKTGPLDLAALAADRDQLLAEARIAFEDGATWWPDAALTEELIEQQEARHEGDEWESKIAAWLDTPTAAIASLGLADVGDPHDGVTTGDVMKGALCIPECDWSPAFQARAGTALRRLGWAPKQQRERGVRVRRYWRPCHTVTSVTAKCEDLPGTPPAPGPSSPPRLLP